MNICFVSQEYPPETGWGGIGTYVYEMANALGERGHRVIVLSRSLEKESYSVEHGIHVYRIKNKYDLSRKRFFWRFQKLITGYRYAVAGELDELVRKHDIDIIESSEIYADLLFYQLTRNTIPAIAVKLHTSRRLVDRIAQNEPKLWNRLEYLAEKLTIQKADLAYSCSAALLEASEAFLPKRDYPVVHNPIAFPQSLPLREDDGKTVLFIGRLEWHKGVQVFGKVIPEVLDRVASASFVFLGPDSSWHGGKSLKKFITDQIPEKMRGSVSFLGGVSRQEVFDHLRAAAVCVLPSRWENFPYTCLEAMACGCPVVGSRNGGMAEMIEHGASGILIDPEKPEEISEQVVRLLKDENLRRSIGQSAAARVREHFSSGRIADQTLEIYRRAIETHSRTKRA